MQSTFRKNVIQYLIKSGKGQKDICEGAKITCATLSRILNNLERKPCVKTVEKVKLFIESEGYEWV